MPALLLAVALSMQPPAIATAAARDWIGKQARVWRHHDLESARIFRAGEPSQGQATAEAAVRDTLQKYSAALESLDPNAVKKVQPSIPVDNLAKAFKDMRELKVDIDAIRVLSLDGTTARVSCRVTQTLTPKVGSKRTTAVTRVMRLKRDAESWVIDGFER